MFVLEELPHSIPVAKAEDPSPGVRKQHVTVGACSEQRSQGFSVIYQLLSEGKSNKGFKRILFTRRWWLCQAEKSHLFFYAQ